MVAVCPHCSARVAIPVGGLVGCPACGRVSRSVAPPAALAAAPAVASAHHRIVWPRVAALAAITLVSGVGAVAALRDVANRAGTPARPAIVASSVLSSAQSGPRMGDLRGVAAQADENMLPTSRTVAGAAAKPRAKAATGPQAGNGFVVITGPRNGPPPQWMQDWADWAGQYDGSSGSSGSGTSGRTTPRQPRQPAPTWP